MKGIALQFGGSGGTRIDLTRTYSDLELDLQNTVVCVMTRKKSDRADPSRGTDLSADVVSGFVSTLNGARHAANFAALEAMRTLRAQTPPPGFSELVLTPTKIEGLTLFVELSVVNSLGDPVTFSTSFQ